MPHERAHEASSRGCPHETFAVSGSLANAPATQFPLERDRRLGDRWSLRSQVPCSVIAAQVRSRAMPGYWRSVLTETRPRLDPRSSLGGPWPGLLQSASDHGFDPPVFLTQSFVELVG
jgi:hypothetical protein